MTTAVHVSTVDVVVKVTDDCWSGYFNSHQVNWTESDNSLLMIHVSLLSATRFLMTSLYAAVVTQAQSGHVVLSLLVC